MSDIQYYGDVAVLQSDTMVHFAAAGKGKAATLAYGEPTAVPVKKLATALEVAPWGEDNRFPQHIENALQLCGIGKSNLDWLARQLWGQGIMPVKVIDYEMNGNSLTEIVQPIKRAGNKEVYQFLEDRRFKRYALEFLRDWKWYWNCFPELILSNDGKKISGIVHQESCDCRYKQMDESGKVDTVYVSKLWGMSQDQFVKFDAKKSIKGLMQNPATITEVDNKFVKAIRCLDMYDDLKDLRKAADELVARIPDGMKSVILPVNYPSANKSYYQLPDWDTCRRVGWMDIAASVPEAIISAIRQAFDIRFHIEIPYAYFERRHGKAEWDKKTFEEKKKAQKDLLSEMTSFLSGADKSQNSLVTFFDSSAHEKGTEYNRVKVNEVQSKKTVDKDLLTSATANTEISIAMGVNPDVTGSSLGGTSYGGNKGGSNLREGKLVNDSGLSLERDVIIAPLTLVRDYNEWDEDIQFRWISSKLTTLDQGRGSERLVS